MADEVLDKDPDEVDESRVGQTMLDDDDDPTIKGDRSEDIDPPLDTKALKTVANEGEDEEEESDEQTGSKMVPHGRFHAVNEAKKALEEQNADLKRQLEEARSGKKEDQEPKVAPEPKIDIDDLESKYVDAVFVGDHDEARSIRRQINDHILKTAEENATARANQALAARDQQNALAAQAEAAYEKFPFLDAKAKDANTEAIAAVVDMRDLFISRGETPVKALKMAVARVGPFYSDGKETSPERTDEFAQQRKARQSDAIRRGAESAARQPPLLKGVGEREKNLRESDVEGMTEEEYEALSTAERKRLRGI